MVEEIKKEGWMNGKKGGKMVRQKDGWMDGRKEGRNWWTAAIDELHVRSSWASAQASVDECLVI